VALVLDLTSYSTFSEGSKGARILLVPSLGEMGTVAGQSKLGLPFLTRIESSVSIANGRYITKIPWNVFEAM